MFFYPLLAESNLFLLTLRGLQAACIILCIIDSRRAYPDQLGLLIALMLAPNLDISFHLTRMLIAVAMAIVDPVKNYSSFVLLGLVSLDAVIEVVLFVWIRVRRRKDEGSGEFQKSNLYYAESKDKSILKGVKDKANTKSSLNSKGNLASTGTFMVDGSTQKGGSLSYHDHQRHQLVPSQNHENLQTEGPLITTTNPAVSTSRAIFNRFVQPMMFPDLHSSSKTDDVHMPQMLPEECVVIEENTIQKTTIQEGSPFRVHGGSKPVSHSYFTMIDVRTDMRARVHNFVRSTSTNHRSSGPHPQEADMVSVHSRMLPNLSKNIESEYLSMVDQVIIVSDQKLSVIYNNYNERFFDRIFKPLRHMLDPQKIRSSQGFKMERVFRPQSTLMHVDITTLALLGQMLDEINVELNSEAVGNYFKSPKTVQVAVSILSLFKKIKKKFENSRQSKGGHPSPEEAIEKAKTSNKRMVRLLLT